jgi:hypothetical protein
MKVSGIELQGGKIHHHKINHIMAGETRFKLTKKGTNSAYQDIQYNWGGTPKAPLPFETSPHSGKFEK